MSPWVNAALAISFALTALRWWVTGERVGAVLWAVMAGVFAWKSYRKFTGAPTKMMDNPIELAIVGTVVFVAVTSWAYRWFSKNRLVEKPD